MRSLGCGDRLHPRPCGAPILAAAETGTVLILALGLSAADEEAVAECAAHADCLCGQFRAGVNPAAIAERMVPQPPAQYDAEIVEMHHRQKVDAPSGTAVAGAGGGGRARHHAR